MNKFNGKQMSEGTHPAELVKSIIGKQRNDQRPFWMTIFRSGDETSRAFFHLDVPRLAPIVERHARKLGLQWEGDDVLTALAAMDPEVARNLEGWEGIVVVKHLPDGKTRTRIAGESEAV